MQSFKNRNLDRLSGLFQLYDKILWSRDLRKELMEQREGQASHPQQSSREGRDGIDDQPTV